MHGTAIVQNLLYIPAFGFIEAGWFSADFHFKDLTDSGLCPFNPGRKNGFLRC